MFFGFLAPSTIAHFQSQDYQQRVDGSQEILDAVKSSPVDAMDVRGLLHLLQGYVTDQNYQTAQNVAQTVSAVINRVVSSGGKTKSLVHQVLKIALLQFDDKRRTVCQLGQTLFIDLLSTNDHFDVINEVVRMSSNPPPKVLSEIFRCFTSLMTQGVLDPSVLLQFPFYFDSALTSQQTSVRQSAVWCVDYIKQNLPDVYTQLVGLLSRDALGVIGKGGNNGSPKFRVDGLFRNRTANTAGQVEAQKAPLVSLLGRTMSANRSDYQRPSLPSGKGAEQINHFIASMIRPVTSKTIVEERNDEKPMFSQTIRPSFAPVDSDDEPGFPDEQPVMTIRESEGPPPRLLDFTRDTFAEEKTDSTEQSYEVESDECEPVTVQPKRFLSEEFRAKAAKARPGLITIDASTLPTERVEKERPVQKPKERHVQFAQTAPLHSFVNVQEEDASGDRPIHASGFYNIGDDVEFDDFAPPPTLPARKKPQFANTMKRMKFKPVQASPEKPKKANRTTTLELLPAKRVKLPQLIEKLKSSEWSDQNDAISDLTNPESFIEQLKPNLRDVVTSILECAGSLRSALAKNALTCLLNWIDIRDIDFEPIADMCASSLLTLVASQKSKHFISELSGKCFSAMMESISPGKAADILNNEHKRKHDDARVQVAASMLKLVERLDDSSVLLTSLSDLVADKNPDVRKSARAAMNAIEEKKK